MTPLETYLYLLTDTIMGNIIFTFHNSFVYKVMMEFGGYNIYIIYFTIVIGSLLGCIINFGVGKILSTQFKLENAFYKDYLLILSGVPIFGEMITMAAGLFQTKLKRMILFVTISKMIYFMLQLML